MRSCDGVVCARRPYDSGDVLDVYYHYDIEQCQHRHIRVKNIVIIVYSDDIIRCGCNDRFSSLVFSVTDVA